VDKKIMMRLRLRIYLTFILSFFLTSCGIFYKPIPQKAWEDEMEGFASWYGKEYHGRKTSSGEVYDMYALTAAHRTLPLGSEVKVTNLENGKEVKVRINDRGPFVEDRIIDLSYNSAKAIEMVNKGVAKVRLSLINQQSSALNTGYLIQAGSFLMFDNALQLKGELEEVCPQVFIETFETNEGKYHRVRIGPFKDKELAMNVISKIKMMKNIHPYLIRAD
jgi:rare lipoprotein A